MCRNSMKRIYCLANFRLLPSKSDATLFAVHSVFTRFMNPYQPVKKKRSLSNLILGRFRYYFHHGEIACVLYKKYLQNIMLTLVKNLYLYAEPHKPETIVGQNPYHVSVLQKNMI